MRRRAGAWRFFPALLGLGLVHCDTKLRRAVESDLSPREPDGGEAPPPPPVPTAPTPYTDGGPLTDVAADASVPTSNIVDAGVAPGADSSLGRPDAAPGAHDASVDASADADAPRFSYSGRLLVDRSLFLDSDVANPNAYVASNGAMASPDFAAEAQPLTSPSRLVGYLGPSVPAGTSTATRPDQVDVYRVDLVAGAPVTLTIATRPTLGATADLDLYLLDENSLGIQAGGSWVDDSMGVESLERVIAPSTGTYWLIVEHSILEPGDDLRQAVYVLDIGIPQSTPTEEAIARVKLSSSWPSLPEVLVPKLRSKLLEQALTRFDDTHIRLEHRSGLGRLALPARPLRGAIDRREVVRLAKRLRRHAEFAAATPNYLYQVSATVGDPSYPDQWHLAQIDIEGAWDATRKVAGAALGEGVLVAVVDTGVAFEHEDWIASDGSSPFVEGGIDFVSPFGQDGLPDLAGDGDGIDLDPTDPGELYDSESGYHGTHIAGIIAAATDNGLGVASVAPNARLLPIRAFGRGGDSALTDVVEAIRYAAGLDNASGAVPPRRADIINMSFSGPKSELVDQACADARAQGVLLIGAIGNAGTLAMSYSPGATEGVIGVGASIDDLRHATYSNVGPEVDVTAPGGYRSVPVLSLGWDDSGSSYVGYYGTSMATAEVSAVAALMKAVWPEMTPDDFDASLASGALTRDLGQPGWDQDYGHGLLDATRAVLAASASASRPLTAEVELRVTPPVLDFGGDADELTLLLENAGDAFGELEVERVESDEPWLTVLPGGAGENVVWLDRTHPELEGGAARATLFVSSNGGDRTVEVRVFTLPRAEGGDVGPLLVEAYVDGGVLDSVLAEAVAKDGGSVEYPYAFTGLSKARFGIRAGSDVAAQGLLGQVGDLYGRKPPTSASSDAGVEGSLLLDLVAPGN